MGRTAAHTSMTRLQLLSMLMQGCDVTATSALGRIALDHYRRTLAMLGTPEAEASEVVIARAASTATPARGQCRDYDPLGDDPLGDWHGRNE
jgi:hypothetical protein